MTKTGHLALGSPPPSLLLCLKVRGWVATIADDDLRGSGADMSTSKEFSGGTAIGGGLLLGMGVGFFLLQESALAFVGSKLSGLGLGLTIASVLSSRRKQG